MSDLWILAGQSNMEGVAKLQGAELSSPHVRSFVHGDRWEIAEEPLHWLPEAVDTVHRGGVVGDELIKLQKELRAERTWGAGLGLTFAKVINERTGVDIDLLPAAHGGTSMSQWNPELKHLGGGSLYGALLRRTKLALQTGGDIKLKGVLWYQGESDGNVQDASRYVHRMQDLIAEIRQDLGQPNLPFFFVQLGCWAASLPPGDPIAQGWNMIREGQRILPSVTEHTAMVSAIDLELDDTIHIGTEGQKRLGTRLASIALNSVYGREAAVGPKLSSVVYAGNGIIKVSYSDVSRMLVSPDRSGRVSGYSIDTGNGRPTSDAIFRTYVDPMSPSDVLLFTDEAKTGSRLYYGEGINPLCQLVDGADMSAPAFGPVVIG
jgi:sialate O-acetylesterase